MRLFDPVSGRKVWDSADPNAGPVPPPRVGSEWRVEGNYSAEPQPAKGIEHYLGGTGIPEKLAMANQMFNPVETIGQSMQAGQRLVSPGRTGWQRVQDTGDMLSGIAGFVGPAVAASKVGAPAASALQEAFLGFSMSPQALTARNFMADEYGGLKLYHGSPHDFDEFSLSKIGTGEGAQAYGHGLYFAENEDVARGYRDSLSTRIDVDGKPILSANQTVGSTGNADVDDLLLAHNGDIDAAIAYQTDVAAKEGPWAASDAEILKRLNDLRGRTSVSNLGRMYEVEVNANPDDFLDWDRPLSEQPQRVQDAISPRVDALRQAGAGIPQDPIGEALWRVAHPQGGFDKTDFSRSVPEQAAERLREAGIPGIRYLDAGSRGAGDGSRNYVVFDDKLISIVRKYGVAGAASMLGVSTLDVEQAMAEGRK